MIIELKKNQSLKLQGPAKIQVVRGKLSVFGGILAKTENILIQEGEIYPFEAEIDSQVDIIANESQFDIINKSLIPPDRKKLAKKLNKYPIPLKIMLLGGIDSGKSTAICFLANYFYSLGKRVAVLDLDVGQQDIGPPCTITMGLLTKLITNLSQISPQKMVFIGKTSPYGRMLQILSGAIGLLAAALDSADIILIDTTGWISGGAARSFKTAMIRTLIPNVLICLQKSNELIPLLNLFKDSFISIEHLTISPEVIPRSYSVRKFLRESNFNQYFKEAKSQILSLRSIIFENATLNSGRKLEMNELTTIESLLQCNFLYAEKSADTLFLVKKPAAFYSHQNLPSVRNYLNVQEIRIVNKNDERGLLIGLLDSTFTTLGLGIIEYINYEIGKIRIFTPVQKDISIVQFGFLRLNKNGQEIENQVPRF
ncbi:MAG: Clp1/GlmU family protein [Candidatus Helarchaeota archaeon]